jgi:hypothetical protein
MATTTGAVLVRALHETFGCSFDEPGATKLAQRCRELTPGLTDEEFIATAIEVFDEGIRTKKTSLIGWMISQTPNHCIGETLRITREKLQAKSEKDRLRRAYFAELQAEEHGGK